ncbi:MAG: RNA 2',3'-cyclic phosphodiesterase [Candidatus Paceibacterota bacterium]
MKFHRVFIAISLPEKIRKLLGAVQDRYLDLPARWVWPDNFHVTLVFLGNTGDQEVMDVCRAAGEIARRHEPFDFTFDRVCYGPIGKELPRMVWAVGEKSPGLNVLQMDLQNTFFESGLSAEALAEAGHSDEEKSFTAHITLARLRQAELRQMDQEQALSIDEKIGRTFLVESIEVMESESKKGGMAYTVLESFKLGE